MLRKLLLSPEEFLSSFLLAGMSVVIVIQVIFRYFISYSLDWPEELGRYLFIASVYIGSSYVEQKERHLSITILRSSGGKWGRDYLPILVQLIVIAFSGLMTIWGMEMVKFVHESQQVAPAIQIPMYLVYTCIPLGMGGMTIRAAVNLYRHCKSLNSPHRDSEEK